MQVFEEGFWLCIPLIAGSTSLLPHRVDRPIYSLLQRRQTGDINHSYFSFCTRTRYRTFAVSNVERLDGIIRSNLNSTKNQLRAVF